uniref:NADH-ubiquinone oxidoreductase chain 3 n=1 Tax=Pnyxia scabiei TaxID=1781627 RepID=A0A7L9R5A9_9DIPT|nr:NADH dehydrogenase subunit 3 [Pnyxia scabiei]QOL10546.1 NADH dehydrogenase subunit 3 [Pnyxia scabiei]
MLSMLYMAMMSLLIPLTMMIMASLLSKKHLFNQEMNSAFECGFDPKSCPRLPFSLQFFLITIIFLIFDVEIILLFPIIITMKFSNLLMWTLTITFFIMILIMGLYHEWNQSALNWLI